MGSVMGVVCVLWLRVYLIELYMGSVMGLWVLCACCGLMCRRERRDGDRNDGKGRWE